MSLRLQASAEPSASEIASVSVAPSASEAPVASVVASASASPEELKLERRLKLRALGILGVSSDTSPAPVKRVPGSPPWVSFKSSRRASSTDVLSMFEAPSDAPSEPATVASTGPASCASVLRPGEVMQTPDLVLSRTNDHDELSVGPSGKSRTVSLPRGSMEGDACVVGSGKSSSLWLAWSTPDHPAELLSISTTNGASKPLHLEGRPGLGGLIDQTASQISLGEVSSIALLEPKKEPSEIRATALLITGSPHQPLAAWSGLARFLSSSSVRVALVRPSDNLTPERITSLLDALDARFGGHAHLIVDRACSAEATQKLTEQLSSLSRPISLLCDRGKHADLASSWAKLGVALHAR
ncbi:MAG: hypothetical protein U0165_02910 [Polyangiaceae bacterium]